MGGHGGLNILPQKRWHLYRDDNRERVSRDERRHREALDEEERQRRHQALRANIHQLRLQRNESGQQEHTSAGTLRKGTGEITVNTETTSGIVLTRRSSTNRASSSTNVTESFGSSLRNTSSSSAPTGFSTSSSCLTASLSTNDNTQPPRTAGAAYSSTNSSLTNRCHINFFTEIEEAEKKSKRKHDKYLEEAGYNPLTSVSDFDVCNPNNPLHKKTGSFPRRETDGVGQSGVPWYVRKQLPSDQRFEAHQREKNQPTEQLIEPPAKYLEHDELPAGERISKHVDVALGNQGNAHPTAAREASPGKRKRRRHDDSSGSDSSEIEIKDLSKKDRTSRRKKKNRRREGSYHKSHSRKHKKRRKQSSSESNSRVRSEARGVERIERRDGEAVRRLREARLQREREEQTMVATLMRSQTRR